VNRVLTALIENDMVEKVRVEKDGVEKSRVEQVRAMDGRRGAPGFRVTRQWAEGGRRTLRKAAGRVPRSMVRAIGEGTCPRRVFCKVCRAPVGRPVQPIQPVGQLVRSNWTIGPVHTDRTATPNLVSQ
jgi:hypothetical protein